MKNFFQNIQDFIRYDLKLKSKLQISYGILIIVPLLLITYISTSNSNKYMQTQMEFSSNQVLLQTVDLVNYKVSSIISASDQLIMPLIQTLKKNETAPITPELISDYHNIRDTMSTVFQEISIQRATLYIKSSIFFSSEFAPLNLVRKICLASLEDAKTEPWLSKVTDLSQKYLWLTTNILSKNGTFEKGISSVRLIKDANNYNEYVGILKIDLPKSQIENIIQKADITRTGVSFLQNSKGELICASNYEHASQFPISIDEVNYISNSGEWRDISINGNSSMVSAIPIEKTDWFLISVIPREEILSVGVHTRNQLLIVMIIIAGFSYLLSYKIAGSTTKRLNILTNNMIFITQNSLNPISGHSGKDEVCKLIAGYNYMIQRLDSFSKQQYQLQIKNKNAELRALQAQINPHFLYNTLDIISWIAQREDVPEIVKIVQELAKYYKLSLNRGQDIVTIKDELDLIETYVALQNHRFKNLIILEIKATDNLKNVLVPKLILQPIVENAIIHGIMPKVEKSGKIIISLLRRFNNILITVADDGVGMTNDKIEAVTNAISTDKSGGYGIKNIDYRIKLRFGKSYGIYFKKDSIHGTTVNIKIPVDINCCVKKNFSLCKRVNCSCSKRYRLKY